MLYMHLLSTLLSQKCSQGANNEAGAFNLEKKLLFKWVKRINCITRNHATEKTTVGRWKWI